MTARLSASTLSVAALMAIATPAHAAKRCRAFGNNEIRQLVDSGLEVRVLEGALMKKFITTFREGAPFFPAHVPVALVIIFKGDDARIAVIGKPGLCNIFTGPKSEIRELLSETVGDLT